jgi:hypothetical protein
MEGHAAKENTLAAQPRPGAGPSSIINLNVGGQVFSTSAETLQAGGDSFFTSLIGDKFKVERDQNNNLFIDRDRKLPPPSCAAACACACACACESRAATDPDDGERARGGIFCATAKLFNTVLNFLRSQCTLLAVDKCNRAKLHSIYAEAEFYALVPLMEEVERQLAELDEEARKLEEERSRHKIHKAFAQRPAKPLVMLRALALALCCAPCSRPRMRTCTLLLAPLTPCLRQSRQSSESNVETPPAPAAHQEQGGEEDNAGDEEDADGTESTPLTQGRYVERTHAGLISDAARHMDMDF